MAEDALPGIDELAGFKSWAPFKIDALGLVTMLGADEVNNYFGQLTTNPLVDWLPQLGGFIIAGGKFREAQPGFRIFNIDDGINTSDVSSWLSRWLMGQSDFYQSLSKVEWELVQPKGGPRELFYRTLPKFIGLVFSGGLLAFTILQGDLFGLLNVVAMILMVLTRNLLISQTRSGLDRSLHQPGKTEGKTIIDEYVDAKRDLDKVRSKHPDRSRHAEIVNAERAFRDKTQTVDLYILLPRGQLVYMTAPRPLVIHAFTRQIEIKGTILSEITVDRVKDFSEPLGDLLDRVNASLNMRLVFRLASIVSWLAFGVHVIFIGQADLAIQLISVVTIIGTTLISTYKVGCNDNYIGSCVRARRTDKELAEEKLLYNFINYQNGGTGNPDRRVYTFARVVRDPNGGKMKQLSEWQLVPQAVNRAWHEKYPSFVDHWTEYERSDPDELRRRIEIFRRERMEEKRAERQRRRAFRSRRVDSAGKLEGGRTETHTVEVKGKR